ncbi:unnamed protein product, partial [Allacma fusca]
PLINPLPEPKNQQHFQEVPLINPLPEPNNQQHF